MRTLVLLSCVGSAALAGALIAAGCTSNPGGGLGGNDAAAPPATTYAPSGCSYVVSPPATRAFTDIALDDGAAAADATGGAPQRVRIGLGGGTKMGQPGYADPTTTAVFTWETATANHAAKVRLGLDPAALTDVHAGYTFTAPPPDVGIGRDEPATAMHEVHVCGLQPGKTYYYQVGGGAAAGVWSDPQSFTTVPATGAVTVGLLGDARDSVAPWQLVHGRMKDAAVNLQILDGDIVDFGTQQSQYTARFDAIWKDPGSPGKFVTLGQQMMIAIAGNHENEAARFYAAFAIPGDGAYAETYASFNAGNTHFTLLDDQQISFGDNSDAAATQLKWLEDDLTKADADRANHPFIVVVSHRGLFSTSKHGTDGDILLARGKLVPIFDKHHVDVVFNGHDHEFERSKPLTAGADPQGAPVVQPSAAQGTTYVISAGAGADKYDVAVTAAPFREKSVGFGPGTSYIGVYSIMTLDARKLTLNSYGLKASGKRVADDDPIDTLELTH